VILRLATLTVLVSCAFVTARPAIALPGLKNPGVIKITARQVLRHSSGTSAGDVEITRVKLYNTRITKKPIGHGDVVCTYLGVGTTQSCNGTFSLPKGQIIVGGTIVSHDIYELAVLGGTRIYSNVRGTLTVTSLGGVPPSSLLLFRLLI